MGPKRRDLTGQRFGRWRTLKFSHSDKGGQSYWLCRCKCGKTGKARGSELVSGRSVMCRSCRQKITNAKNTKHGQASNQNNKKPTSEYRAWASMINRCERPTYRGFARYGGRGVKICARWRKSFENFFADMGKKPSPAHSLDRYPNGDGDYKPSNCRWATPKQQSNNRRNPWITRRAKMKGRKK